VVAVTRTVKVSGVGLTGVLRLTWVRDDLAHVLQHAGTDEPTGTWIGRACPDRGLTVGSDVDAVTLQRPCGRGEIADLLWEAPSEFVAEHEQVHSAAMLAYEMGEIERAERHWRNLGTIWSGAWTANCAALGFMEEAGLSRFSPVKPQRWVVASFEHHCGPHGAPQPHVHNIVITALTAPAAEQ
jgi:hypothetical protein